MKTVTIPNCKDPYVVIVNNKEYVYKAGETVSVPDEVAEIIESHNEVNHKEPDATEPSQPSGGGSDNVVVIEASSYAMNGEFAVPNLTEEQGVEIKSAFNSGKSIIIISQGYFWTVLNYHPAYYQFTLLGYCESSQFYLYCIQMCFPPESMGNAPVFLNANMLVTNLELMGVSQAVTEHDNRITTLEQAGSGGSKLYKHTVKFSITHPDGEYYYDVIFRVYNSFEITANLSTFAGWVTGYESCVVVDKGSFIGYPAVMDFSNSEMWLLNIISYPSNYIEVNPFTIAGGTTFTDTVTEL